MDPECGETLVLDQAGVQELPEAIRKVCEASGMFLTIEVPGLGRALIIPEKYLGDLMGLFKNADFASTLERGVADAKFGRGVVQPAGLAPGDELIPLCDPCIADSVERGQRDFAQGKGVVRKAGVFPA